MLTQLEYKSEIRGLEDVAETVRTEEKIAAAGLHALRHRVDALKRYTAEVGTVLVRLSAFFQGTASPLMERRAVGPRALVVIGGDKGLVGTLWHDLVSAVVERGRRYERIYVVGERSARMLEEDGFSVTRQFSSDEVFVRPDGVDRIGRLVFNSFRDDRLASVDMAYPSFLSLAEQQPKISRILPLASDFNPTGGVPSGTRAAIASGLPIFEPGRQKVFEALLQKHLGTVLQTVFLEARLSELAARTVSTESAAAKADQLLRRRRREYFKERRRTLTDRQLTAFIGHQPA